jgi:hypothetical protein
MSPDELDRIVTEGRVPGRPDEYWKAFPGLVRQRLSVPTESAPRRWRLVIALAAATACGLFLGFVIWHRHLPSGYAYDSFKDGRILRKLQAQYPGRLQAIVQDDSGLHTQLSDVADVSASDPILLEIRDGKDHRVIVTFSGQLVRCGSRNVMVLSDISGQVMLVGDGFFWSHQASTGLEDIIQVRAEKIASSRSPSNPTPSL